jgi:hypothetical protein
VKGIVFVGLAFAYSLFCLLGGLNGIEDRYGITVPYQEIVQSVPIVPCGLHSRQYGLFPAGLFEAIEDLLITGGIIANGFWPYQIPAAFVNDAGYMFLFCNVNAAKPQILLRCFNSYSSYDSVQLLPAPF